jgi:hypothetical protein
MFYEFETVTYLQIDGVRFSHIPLEHGQAIPKNNRVQVKAEKYTVQEVTSAPRTAEGAIQDMRAHTATRLLLGYFTR